MENERPDRRPCTVDGCDGTMTHSVRAIEGDRSAFHKGNGVPVGFRPDEAGWTCDKNPEHVEPESK